MNVKIVEPVFSTGGYSRGRTPVWRGLLERNDGREKFSLESGFEERPQGNRENERLLDIEA